MWHCCILLQKCMHDCLQCMLWLLCIVCMVLLSVLYEYKNKPWWDPASLVCVLTLWHGISSNYKLNIIIAVISFHPCYFHQVSFILKAMCHALKAKLSTKWSCTCPVSNWHGGWLPSSHTHCSLSAETHSARRSAFKALCRLSSFYLPAILLFWWLLTKDWSILNLTHIFPVYTIFSTNELNKKQYRDTMLLSFNAAAKLKASKIIHYILKCTLRELCLHIELSSTDIIPKMTLTLGEIWSIKSQLPVCKH